MRKLEAGEFKVVPGEFYGTPKEMWGFRVQSRGAPVDIARRFLVANGRRLGLERNLGGLQLRKIIDSLGASHVIFQQVHQGRRVHRAYVTVHISANGAVFLVKNRAMPDRLLPQSSKFLLSVEELIRRARRSLPMTRRAAVVRDFEYLWYPNSTVLVPAGRVRLSRRAPAEEWIIHVNAATGGVLNRYDNAAYLVEGSARVFDPSPATTLGTHEDLLTKQRRPRRPPAGAYRTVRLKGLSRTGYLEGEHVTTGPTRRRVRSAARRFHFQSHRNGFEEAMVYFHVDSALRYLKGLGFRGSRAIFQDPIKVNVNGTRQDNSWYTPWDRVLTFGTGGIDDAEDGETILHELGHAIQDAIVPDFGQSAEAAAIGEGFGDYFAASFFAARKPRRYQPCVLTWNHLIFGVKRNLDPPCLRRVDGAHTYDDFNENRSEHRNGEIWSSVLWEIRQMLGRRVADRLIIESHFQLDGFTTFARAARAILDADDNIDEGRHRETLRMIFRRKRIRPVG